MSGYDAMNESGYENHSPGELPDIFMLLNEHILTKHRVFPLDIVDGRLKLAMVNPLNLEAMDDIKLLTGMDIYPVKVTEEQICLLIQRHFGLTELGMPPGEMQAGESNPVPGEKIFTEADGPVVRLVNSLLSQAVMEKASDIHLEPFLNNVVIRFRIDGLLREITTLPASLKQPLAARIKILANMNIVEKRLPQDGRFKIIHSEREIDLRVSTMATIFGERLVIRILDRKTQRMDMDELGLSERNLNLFHDIINSSIGMVLITGPTGSGKTTTLYSALTRLKSADKNIMTIEDPVEYVLEGINQTQVNTAAGITFKTGLRSILRQDPNIIMIGEIRDGDTASMAVRASTTGQLVLSTMHTNDAPGAITRLLEMSIEPYLIASTVLSVMTQRLVRICCRHCRTGYGSDDNLTEYEFIKPYVSGLITLYKGSGCKDCGYTGFRGRTAISEIMPVTEEIRQLICTKATSTEIRKAAEEQGMISLRENGILKALAGVTTVTEVIRVTQGYGGALNQYL